MDPRLTFCLATAVGLGGCALFGAFDEEYALDGGQASAPIGGSGGDAGHDVDTSLGGAEGGGDPGQVLSGGGPPGTCFDWCPSGHCIAGECAPWTHTFSGSGMTHTRFVSTGPDGSIVAVGDFDGTITIGQQVLVSRGDRDVFVAQFSRAGEARWARSAGGSWFDEPSGVDVDDSGAIFVALTCQNAEFPPLGYRGNAGGDDVCVVKYNAEGMALWAESFGSPNWDRARGIAAGFGGVYIVGEFDTMLTVGSTTLGAATIGGFVVKLSDTTGQPVWARETDSPNMAVPMAVDVDPRGDVDITGWFTSSVEIGGITLYDDDGSQDLFVTKLDPNGAAIWAKRLFNTQPGNGWAFVHGIASVGTDVVVAGGFDGSWNFGGGAVNASGLQGFVVRRSEAGDFVWQQTITSPMFSELRGVAATPAGDVVVTGQFDGASATFGTHVMNNPEPFAPSTFMAHIGPSGSVDGATMIEGVGYRELQAPHIHGPNNNVVLAGSFDGTLDVGTDMMANGLDGFLVSYGSF